MEKTIIKVEGMSCEHCVNAIQSAVGALGGIAEVSVDLAAKTVTVMHEVEKSPVADIKAAIEDQGYEVLS